MIEIKMPQLGQTTDEVIALIGNAGEIKESKKAVKIDEV